MTKIQLTFPQKGHRQEVRPLERPHKLLVGPLIHSDQAPVLCPRYFQQRPDGGNNTIHAFLYLFGEDGNGGVGLRYNQATPIENWREIGAGDRVSEPSRMECRQ